MHAELFAPVGRGDIRSILIAPCLSDDGVRIAAKQEATTISLVNAGVIDAENILVFYQIDSVVLVKIVHCFCRVFQVALPQNEAFARLDDDVLSTSCPGLSLSLIHISVAGKTGSSCMITLTDRKSRFLLLKKIQKKNSLLVRDGIVELLLQLPSDRVASITPDRGKEFSRHFEISKALNGLQFYFPNPHSPWQRGTNENTNGLIREYCPKSVDLETFHDSYFSAFTAKLNHRPRKCLDWKSPYEVFFGLVLHLT